MRVVTLIEDTCPQVNSLDLHAEHGIALYIETGSHRILFDTGPDASFLKNAQRLGIDLLTVGLAVVSHGHYDHGGGVQAFCSMNATSDIYLHSRAVRDGHYAVKAGKHPRDAGFSAGKHQNRLAFVDTAAEAHWQQDASWEILPGILLFGSFPDHGYVPSGNRTLYVSPGTRDPEHLQQDDFSHEIAMLIREEQHTVLISGCSHRGIGNIIERAITLAETSCIDAVIGGFHLTDSELQRPDNRGQIEALAGKLSEYPVEAYYTGHCTGRKSLTVLKSVLKERVRPITTGLEIVI